MGCRNKSNTVLETNQRDRRIVLETNQSVRKIVLEANQTIGHGDIVLEPNQTMRQRDNIETNYIIRQKERIRNC
jgi:hypothetical protein